MSSANPHAVVTPMNFRCKNPCSNVFFHHLAELVTVFSFCFSQFFLLCTKFQKRALFEEGKVQYEAGKQKEVPSVFFSAPPLPSLNHVGIPVIYFHKSSAHNMKQEKCNIMFLLPLCRLRDPSSPRPLGCSPF